jgi:hypothetical protein
LAKRIAPCALPAIKNVEQPHTFRILYPPKGGSIQGGRPLTITVEHTGPQELEKVEYYVNGVYMGASNGSPFSITVVPEKRSGDTVIRAVGHVRFSGGMYNDSTTVSTN